MLGIHAKKSNCPPPACLPLQHSSPQRRTSSVLHSNSVTFSKPSLVSIAKPVLGVGIHSVLCGHALFMTAPVLVESRIKGPDVVSLTCNPSTQVAEEGASRVQSEPWLLSEFKTSLGYMRPYVKQTNKNPQRVKRKVRLKVFKALCKTDILVSSAPFSPP